MASECSFMKFQEGFVCWKKKNWFSRREIATIKVSQNWITDDSKQLNIAYSKAKSEEELLFLEIVACL